MNPESESTPAGTAGEAERLHARLGELLAQGERLALCTILRLAGSGPRRAGAKMIVRGSGELVGTIGGGLLEARATLWGQDVLATASAVCRRFVLTSVEAGGDGMTCGGEMEVLVECLDGKCPDVVQFFAQVQSFLGAGEHGHLVTALRQEDGTDRVLVARALFADGRLVATQAAESTPISEELLRTSRHAPVLIQRGVLRYFVERLAPPITVIICGAGHIAAQLVPLCRPLGFRTIVIDDRADFANSLRFPLADRLIVASSLERALDGLTLDQNSYVVVVTRGHAGDLAIVRQALRGRPGYIGMIGSQRKRGVVFEALAREGCDATELARITCPIGLPIGAETPEEIAVSIVAQLVATRAREDRRPQRDPLQAPPAARADPP